MCNTAQQTAHNRLSVPLERVSPDIDLSKIPDSTLGMHFNLSTVKYALIIIDDSHLSVLVTALRTVYQWFPLGIHLGLSYSDLKKVEANERGQVEMCKINMLDMWLKGSEEKCSKRVLESALSQLASAPQPLLPNMSGEL